MAAESRRNPLDALRRTFDITRGRGWAVFGLVLLVGIAGVVVTGVVNMVLGIVFTIVAGRDLGGLLSLIVSSATGAALTVVLTLLYAAIYRALLAGDPAADDPSSGI